MRDLPPAALLSKGLPQLALGQVEIKQPCGWKGGEHFSHHPMPLRVDLSKKLQSGAKLGLPEPSFPYRIRAGPRGISTATPNTSPRTPISLFPWGNTTQMIDQSVGSYLTFWKTDCVLFPTPSSKVQELKLPCVLTSTCYYQSFTFQLLQQV